MNKLLFLVILVPLIYSCNNVPEVNDELIITKVDPVIPEEDMFNYDTLKGMYVGDFAGSDIRIIMNYVSKKKAIGYNIHKGLQRNLNGIVSRNGDSITIIMSEPGDNEYDGVFTLLFIGDDHQPTGKWVANNGKIPSKTFKLSKMIKPEVEKEGDINFSNFADYFGYISDSIGNYQFKDDGLCIFEYYPEEDDEDRVEQMAIIHGTWSLEGKTVTIDWQPNEVYKDRKLVLEVYTSEWGEISLRGENHDFYNHYYGP